MQTSKPTVEIIIEAPEPKVRHREPVTCGVPWPKGMLRDPDYLILHDEKGESIPLQTRILDRWLDGSVRWLLVDWQATVRGDTRLALKVSDVLPAMPTAGALRVKQENKTFKTRTFHKSTTIKTGVGEFRIAGLFPFDEAIVSSPKGSWNIETNRYPAGGVGVFVEYGHRYGLERDYPAWIEKVQLEDMGLIRSSVVQGSGFSKRLIVRS